MDLLKIKSPADIRSMSVGQLNELAADMRDALLRRLSRAGGHVGPNLGVIEATIALHYVFDTPNDKIVFDVSHQSYPHKMLTGRMADYVDPDDYAKVSGYTCPKESPLYDLFEIGHTSTSVALATGLAKARDLAGGHENVVAFIGDGSLSGGEAFEGLDYGATLGSNFIVVANDNNMSIAPVHGGVYRNFTDLRHTNGTDPCNYFRALGYDYIYVAEGNNIEALIKAFESVRGIDHPIVVHINTQKGEGYAPAEENREKFHYSAPFDLKTGELLRISDAPDFSSLTAEYLLERIKRDPLTVAITAATPSVFGFLPRERERAGKNFVDVGIAEQDAVAMSAGLAKAGANPFFGVYSTFIQRAYDQMSQEVCINNLPAVFGIFGGSMYSLSDVTHLCFFDIPLLSNIPNLVYLAPTCRDEYLAMLEWAMNQKEHPVALRVPVMPCVPTPDRKYPTDYSDLNKSVVERRGSRVAIIGVGNFFGRALEAADILKRDHNIDATVINPRYLTGLDTALLDSLRDDHSLVVTLEDGITDGGYGQKVAAYLSRKPGLRVDVRGLPKEFLDRFDARKLSTELRLDPGQIAEDIANSL